MRSTFTRLITVSVAAVIAAGAVAPASAATRHKRAAPAQAESSSNPDVIGLPIHPAWSPIPSTVYQAPNSCFTDEGYGRYTSCEQGGF